MGHISLPPMISTWAAQHGRVIAGSPWAGSLDSITVRLTRPDAKDLHATWSPHDLLPEAERMSWLAGRHPAPRMFDFEEFDDGSLIVSSVLPGAPASLAPDRWGAAAAVGEGLAVLHTLDPSISMFGAPAWASEGDIDVLVIAHGDATVAHTMVSDSGAFTGHVGLCWLGVADRWADLAVAAQSLRDTFGVGADRPMWEAYGIDPDPDREAQYLDLYRRAHR